MNGADEVGARPFARPFIGHRNRRRLHTLLDTARRYARDAGIEVHDGRRVDAGRLDANLVIAADGSSSATRGARKRSSVLAFRPMRVRTCGAAPTSRRPALRAVGTEFGTFVAHAYPYRSDRCTFLIETDEQTWQRAGFDLSTDGAPLDASGAKRMTWS